MTSHKPDEIAYRYVANDGEFMAGIPTTDITYADLETLSPLALRNLAHSPLYEAANQGVTRVQQEPANEAPEPDKTAKGGKES